MTKDKILAPLKLIGKGFGSLLFPADLVCIFCGDELKGESYFGACEKCHELLMLDFSHNKCPRCGANVPPKSTSVCMNCKRNNFEFELATSCFAYMGRVKSAIYDFKYRGCKEYAKHFAGFIAEKFMEQNWKIDLVTSIPLYHKSEKKRGFNQARELAFEFCKLTGLPYIECGIRKRDTKTQTNMSTEERKQNVLDAFQVFNKEVKNKNMLIIDDVFTTGSTSNEFAKALKNAHANKVFVLSIAHTVFDDNKKI